MKKRGWAHYEQLEGVSLVDGLLPSEAGSEYMGGGGCRLKDKFDRKLIRFRSQG